jgi:hypothetical protein
MGRLNVRMVAWPHTWRLSASSQYRTSLTDLRSYPGLQVAVGVPLKDSVALWKICDCTPYTAPYSGSC